MGRIFPVLFLAVLFYLYLNHRADELFVMCAAGRPRRTPRWKPSSTSTFRTRCWWSASRAAACTRPAAAATMSSSPRPRWPARTT
ncbi:hypothetical protein PF006_g28165 [Phytophthora fragariae]|uniref:Uncharacterized protein n=1 Tax=Phytophthora fragariae TaxID=53985 RepID=A0A6A3QJ53_9STRA|nr:hypothetical protein PF009_g18160 [Phytophthora fragariae]KAE9076263.1 hypothetical protein PF006_g28165 [Phytophthora fragariae]KAE9269708.1 hypothetical protein PF008_g30794 [Phytophthora fragariae]